MAGRTHDEGELIAAIKDALRDLGGAQQSSTIAGWISHRFPSKWANETVGSYLRRCSVNLPGPISRHPGYEHFLYCRGRAEFELYDEGAHGAWNNEGLPEGEQKTPELIEEAAELIQRLESSNEFVYEAHLRDYLAKNLSLIESGLTLWTGVDRSNIPSLDVESTY